MRRINDPLSRYLIRGAAGFERDLTGVRNFSLYASHVPLALPSRRRNFRKFRNQIVLRRTK
jgi:hypothetical protein